MLLKNLTKKVLTAEISAVELENKIQKTNWGEVLKLQRLEDESK